MTDVVHTGDLSLDGCHIIVGVTGGIAAYKTPQLVRLLRESGAEVQVVTTAAARHFVTTTTLQAVSGRPVRDDLWDPAAEASMGHIELARWADLILIAPATADTLSRLAQGRADDLLCTLRLASTAAVVLAPAMNHRMWLHPATQRSIGILQGDGCTIVGPDSGAQACGEFGPGRMTEPADLVRALTDLWTSLRAGQHIIAVPAGAGPDSLKSRRVLITAGPTREAIDPVRFLTNHSSGKQGYALAEAARDAGATVTLVSGPVTLPAPAGIDLVRVTSALEMHEAVQTRLDRCDVFIGVAAVADYRPSDVAPQKLKKQVDGAGIQLALVENPDIIAAVARHPARPYIVGFAAETHDAIAHARAKLERKGMDLIVVNDVSDDTIGFNSDQNDVTLISASTEERLTRRSKAQVAREIIARIGDRIVDRSAFANPHTVTE